MAGLQNIVGRKPSVRSMVPLPPSAFSDSWTRRPSSPQKIGLRIASEEELSYAQKLAAQSAYEMYPPNEPDMGLRIGEFNDHLMTNVLARVCCNADTGEPFFAPVPELLIREALSPGGILYLWDKFLALSIADGALSSEATDDELVGVPDALTLENVAKLSLSTQVRVRKLARALLAEIALDVQ